MVHKQEVLSLIPLVVSRLSSIVLSCKLKSASNKAFVPYDSEN